MEWGKFRGVVVLRETGSNSAITTNPQHERHARIGHTVDDGQHEERDDVLHFIGRGRSAATSRANSAPSIILMRNYASPLSDKPSFAKRTEGRQIPDKTQ